MIPVKNKSGIILPSMPLTFKKHFLSENVGYIEPSKGPSRMKRIPQETAQFVHVWQPNNKREDQREDWVERKNSAACAEIGRRYTLLTTLEPLSEKWWTKKTKNKNPWEWSIVIKFLPKVQGVVNSPCKNKQTQWSDKIHAIRQV